MLTSVDTHKQHPATLTLTLTATHRQGVAIWSPSTFVMSIAWKSTVWCEAMLLKPCNQGPQHEAGFVHCQLAVRFRTDLQSDLFADSTGLSHPTPGPGSSDTARLLPNTESDPSMCGARTFLCQFAKEVDTENEVAPWLGRTE